MMIAITEDMYTKMFKEPNSYLLAQDMWTSDGTLSALSRRM